MSGPGGLSRPERLRSFAERVLEVLERNDPWGAEWEAVQAIEDLAQEKGLGTVDGGGMFRQVTVDEEVP